MHIDIIVDEVCLLDINILFSNCFFSSASDAVKRNLSPIIIDNTNTQVWEMKPYVAMVNIRYRIL